jgi:hypothetical protein
VSGTTRDDRPPHHPAPPRRGRRAYLADTAGIVGPAVAAGATGGLLVGGVGGRLAMFVLRLTSPASLHGLESDDGFTIGRFSAATAFLLFLTAVLGVLVGLGYLVFRAVVPDRWRVPAFGALGGLVGGTAILHEDGIDFVLVRPQVLAVASFIAIPLLGALAIARLTDRWIVRWPRWSARRRVASLVPAAPWLIVVVVSAASLAVVALALAVIDAPWARRPRVVRTAVLASRLVLVATATGAAALLVRDIDGIL